MAELEKMTITPCTVEESGDIKAKGDSEALAVMINPASFTHEHSISYSKDKPLGSSAEDLKFSAIDAEKVSFDLVLDGTGVVPDSSDDVKDQVDKLKSIVYAYDGSEHQTNPVRLSWGSFLFFGRLTSLSLEYTLFKPSGEPLRAKAKLSITGYMSKEEEALRANKSSPDLTHVIEVKAGDTLPLLCYRVYRDAAYYPEVARLNKLDNFRDLCPGVKLKFPPLR